MKIAIIGAGNIGSLLGALLTNAGEDVTLVELREEIVQAVRDGGVRVDTSDGRILHASPKITSRIDDVAASDLIVLAVKSNATRSATEGVARIITQDPWILSVQNGAGNIEQIVDVLGDHSKVLGGVFFCSVTPLDLNHVMWVVGTGGLKIGPASGAVTSEVEQIANIFRAAGLDVAVAGDVQRLIWDKVLQNVPLALGAAMGMTNDEYAAHPHAKEIIVRMAEECLEVTTAAGIRLDDEVDPVEELLRTLQKFHDSGAKPKCSMLQDLERGRPTEIDAINGSIVREGKRLGIPTPINEVMVSLVKLQEERNAL